jgi:multidrug resistance efflux pump
MSTRSTRIGALVGLAALLAVTIAAGQHRAAVGTDPEGQAVAVFNPVEGRIRVLSSRPEGARVEKGEVICELDPAELRDRVASQEIAVQGLRAGVEGARFAREAAAMDLDEYKDGGFARDSAAAQAAVRLAQSDMRRHEETLDWTRRMFDKGYASPAEKRAEELAFEKAKYAVELAQAGRQVLAQHTREKIIRTLTGAVETARERELGKEAELRRAESILKSLHDQIGWCKVAALVAGRIRYDAPIGPGAVVRDGQVLVRVVPDTAPAGAAK